MALAFAEELAEWGPAAAPKAVSLPQADAYCARLAKTHYENFPVLTWVLPRNLRPHFARIYAYCRWADDLADEVSTPDLSLALLAWWRNQLHCCYAGEPEHPVFVALKPTIQEFEIPPQPFEDLLVAFQQDQRIHEYDTFDQLLDYCRKSANPVGRLVLYLFRQADEKNFAWSDSICTGLQLANFWQDVARDKDRGRVYLPADDWRMHGYTDDDLQARITNDAFVQLLRYQVDRTRKFLQPWASPSPSELRDFPFRHRLMIDLFTRGGLTILERIEAIEYRVWDQRPKLVKSDFARMTLAALLAAAFRR